VYAHLNTNISDGGFTYKQYKFSFIGYSPIVYT